MPDARVISLVVQFPEPERSEALLAQCQKQGKFTSTISYPDYSPEGVHLCLLSFRDRDVAAVGLGWRSILKPVSFSFRLRFDHITLFLKPLNIDRLLSGLPAHKVSEAGPVIKLDDDLWEVLKKRLLQHEPSLEVALTELEEIIANYTFVAQPKIKEVLGEQKDALGVALDIFGADRKQVFEEWREPDGEIGSFFDGLPNLVSEDTALAHDWGIFSGLDLQGTRGATKTFEKRSSKGKVLRRLRVMLTNRTKLESTLGVDMIYYVEDLGSFVLVQYKRMRQESQSGAPVYRPENDGNYQNEVIRMQRVNDICEGVRGVGHEHFRLREKPCYLKFISDDDFHPTGGELINGRYVPLDYWLELLDDPITKGRKDAVRVYWHHLKRYLSNAQFTGLVGDAWIGSSGVGTAELQELVAASLQGNRALLLAHEKRFPDEPKGGSAGISQPLAPVTAESVSPESKHLKIHLHLTND